ncbi:MAG: CoA-binding protein [Promethearchaeota archaeon]|jgi:acyl-CoA synthetase (NDP forming)
MTDLFSEIDDIFHSESLAIYGVSRKGGLGNVLLQGFIDQEFPKIFIVNPRITESNVKINGVPVFSDLKSIGEPIDLVICSTHPKFVREIIIECGENGVKAVIIFSAGFGEKNEEGKKVEKELLKIARKYQMRLIGPNCMGLYCPSSKLSFFPSLPTESGSLGLISQSGSIANLMAFVSMLKGIYFSKAISYGNGIDLGFNDFLEYLADDSDTKIIACYLEGVNDGRRFIELVKKIKKPIIIWKAGVTSGGSKAAYSHTGSICGNNELWNKVFHQYGVIRVYNMEEMVSMIQAFINPIPVRKCRVAILSGPGGPAVSSADACEMNNLKLAELTNDSKLKLQKIIPEFGSSFSNPIDLSLQVVYDPMLEKKAYEIVGMDSNVDMMLIWLSMLNPRYKDLIILQKKISKPITIVSAIDVNVSSDSFSSTVKGSFMQIRAKKVPGIIKILNQSGISVHPNEHLAAKALYNIYQFHDKSMKSTFLKQ